MTAGQDNAGRDDAPAAEPRQGEASREAAFRRAVSHSRRVQFLKLALPVAALLIAGSFAAYSYVSVPGDVSFDVTDSAYSNGKLVMANPTLAGYTKDNRPYSMIATRALQHIKESAIVELEGIAATLPVSNGNIAKILADHGIYNRDRNTLVISSPITVTTADGNTATLQSANLDIGKGNLLTKDPVSIKMGGVELSAGTMRVIDNGKVVVFKNKVRMVLQPGHIKTTEGGPSTE
jgi:lipopolysaccharide export system protein LptC